MITFSINSGHFLRVTLYTYTGWPAKCRDVPDSNF